ELFGPSARPGSAAPFISNASMYDGASAAAESVLMARRLTGRGAALICGAVHPQYVETIGCYLSGLCNKGESLVHHAPLSLGGDGRVDLPALERLLKELGPTLACVVVQTPNYLGVVEDLPAIAARAHAASALVVAVCTEPLALGVLDP